MLVMFVSRKQLEDMLIIHVESLYKYLAVTLSNSIELCLPRHKHSLNIDGWEFLEDYCIKRMMDLLLKTVRCTGNGNFVFLVVDDISRRFFVHY